MKKFILIATAFTMCGAPMPTFAADYAPPSATANSELLKRAMSPSDIGVTFTINSIPIGYKTSEAELKQADELFNKALKVARFSSGENQNALSAALDCSGVFYYRSSEFAKSAQCFEDALALKRKASSSTDIATSCALLGQVYRAAGRSQKAESLYAEACRLKETEFGANAPETAAAYMELASLYYDLGNISKAQEAESKARAVVESNRQVGRDISAIVTPFALACAPASSALPGLKEIAGGIISAHEMEVAEHNAENEALTSLRTGVAPAHKTPQISVRTVSGQVRQESDDEDLQRKRLELAKQLLEEQERARKHEAEMAERDAEARLAQQRQADEERARRTADEAARRLEEQQAALQRQREAQGTGTSYMSRYK